MAELSIIMGAYNCEKTLGESLESILNQTYSDFLCYVCDDGSSDGTASVIKAYAEKDSRIVFMQSDRNCGLAVTLNRLIALCRTPYIARMDGDDIAEPNRLEKQIKFLEAHPEYDLCGSAVRYFDETGFWGEHIYPEQPERKDFLFVNPFAHPTVMFRTSSILKMTVLEKNRRKRKKHRHLFRGPKNRPFRRLRAFYENVRKRNERLQFSGTAASVQRKPRCLHQA